MTIIIIISSSSPPYSPSEAGAKKHKSPAEAKNYASKKASASKARKGPAMKAPGKTGHAKKAPAKTAQNKRRIGEANPLSEDTTDEDLEGKQDGEDSDDEEGGDNDETTQVGGDDDEDVTANAPSDELEEDEGDEGDEGDDGDDGKGSAAKDSEDSEVDDIHRDHHENKARRKWFKDKFKDYQKRDFDKPYRIDLHCREECMGDCNLLDADPHHPKWDKATQKSMAGLIRIGNFRNNEGATKFQIPDHSIAVVDNDEAKTPVFFDKPAQRQASSSS